MATLMVPALETADQLMALESGTAWRQFTGSLEGRRSLKELAELSPQMRQLVETAFAAGYSSALADAMTILRSAAGREVASNSQADPPAAGL